MYNLLSDSFLIFFIEFLDMNFYDCLEICKGISFNIKYRRIFVKINCNLIL